MLKAFNPKSRAELTQADAQQKQISISAKKIYADGSEDPERWVAYGHKWAILHYLIAPIAYYNGAFWEWYYTRKRRIAHAKVSSER